MKSERQKVAQEKMSQKLENMSFHERPTVGWVKAIREALGMTTYQFGKRLGISQSSVVDLEKREKTKSITLRSLEEAARALNCRLHYVLVPEKPFAEIIEERAEKIAKKRLQKISSSMDLEDQSVSKPDMETHLKRTIEQISNEKRSQIWDED